MTKMTGWCSSVANTLLRPTRDCAICHESVTQSFILSVPIRVLIFHSLSRFPAPQIRQVF